MVRWADLNSNTRKNLASVPWCFRNPTSASRKVANVPFGYRALQVTLISWQTLKILSAICIVAESCPGRIAEATTI